MDVLSTLNAVAESISEEKAGLSHDFGGEEDRRRRVLSEAQELVFDAMATYRGLQD